MDNLNKELMRKVDLVKSLKLKVDELTKAYEIEKMAHCDTLKERDNYMKKYIDRKKTMKQMKGHA